MILKIIAFVATKFGLQTWLASLIVWGVMALVAGGTMMYLKHSYDEGKREEGRQLCVAEARAVAEANRVKAAAIDAEHQAEAVKREKALRVKLASARAAPDDACSKAPALPVFLEGLK